MAGFIQGCKVFYKHIQKVQCQSDRWKRSEDHNKWSGLFGSLWQMVLFGIKCDWCVNKYTDNRVFCLRFWVGETLGGTGRNYMR